MTAAAGRQRERDELLALTGRLIAEYAAIIAAGSVRHTVACCHADALRTGARRNGMVGIVERAARARVTGITPAHSDA